MRKTIMSAAIAAAALIAPASNAAEPVEGCQAFGGVVPYCTYVSTGVGSILGAGSGWRVVVHWSGNCSDVVTHGANGWIRSGSADNNIEGIAGAWEGSVAGPGYCVEAMAEVGSAVLVGFVGDDGQSS